MNNLEEIMFNLRQAEAHLEEAYAINEEFVKDNGLGFEINEVWTPVEELRTTLERKMDE